MAGVDSRAMPATPRRRLSRHATRHHWSPGRRAFPPRHWLTPRHHHVMPGHAPRHHILLSIVWPLPGVATTPRHHAADARQRRRRRTIIAYVRNISRRTPRARAPEKKITPRNETVRDELYLYHATRCSLHETRDIRNTRHAPCLRSTTARRCDAAQKKETLPSSATCLRAQRHAEPLDEHA